MTCALFWRNLYEKCSFNDFQKAVSVGSGLPLDNSGFAERDNAMGQWFDMGRRLFYLGARASFRLHGNDLEGMQADVHESAEKLFALSGAIGGTGNETGTLQEYAQQLLAVSSDIEEEKLRKLYENKIFPLLYQIQKMLFQSGQADLEDDWGKNRLALRKKDFALYHRLLTVREQISDQYRLSWAKTGDLALDITVGQKTVRINSNYNPWKEAFLFAENADIPGGAYTVVGFGIGYHIEALLQRRDLKRLVVLEHDLNQLAIAFSYRNFKEILSDNKLSIVYCGKWKDYQEWLFGGNADWVSVWYPSVQSICDRALREQLENYWVELSSARNFSPKLEENFTENVVRGDEEVSVLQDRFCGKNMILVAGGPSLDENLELLREFGHSGHLLVCVGKVAKKLVQAGILPDYIVAIDAKEGTKWQISGIEDCGVPLIYLCTAAARLVNDYQGKRYIAFQRGFQPAKDYAEKMRYRLYQTGGSVATFAIDLGICFRCRKIICVGLDMGYPGRRTHASGIGREIATDRMLRKVEGIVEDTVYTSKTLDIYRRWIEERIAGEQETEFINASKGARIHGMKEQDLKEFLRGVQQ